MAAGRSLAAPSSAANMFVVVFIIRPFPRLLAGRGGPAGDDGDGPSWVTPPPAASADRLGKPDLDQSLIVS